jgi:hypothetical protein
MPITGVLFARVLDPCVGGKYEFLLSFPSILIINLKWNIFNNDFAVSSVIINRILSSLTEVSYICGS